MADTQHEGQASGEGQALRPAPGPNPWAPASPAPEVPAPPAGYPLPGPTAQDHDGPPWAASGWGQQGNWGAPPPPPPAAAPAPAPGGDKWPQRPRLLAAGFIATAVVFGGAGVGVGVAVANGNSHHPGRGVTLPTAAKTSPNSDTQFNVAAIAKQVERATLDITAKDPGGEQDEGTGMVLTSSGIVLTNNHVVSGSTHLSAQLNGAGRTYNTTVLGVDTSDDVALLQLHGASNFKTVLLGNSSNINVGDQVVAIGNALALPGPETVTSGIISATGRSVSVSDPVSGLQENLKGLFQTSAPINPGNSGGPLVDGAGQVIAMNTASATGTGQTTSNVGFAIPINESMSIARQVLAGKGNASIIIGQRPIIGVDVVSVACAQGAGQGCPGGENPFNNFPFGSGYSPPVPYGAIVDNVNQGSPAQLAGIGFGDVIVSFSGHHVKTVDALTAILEAFKVGQKVSVGWVDPRGGSHKAAVKLIAG